MCDCEGLLMCDWCFSELVIANHAEIFVPEREDC